VAFLDKCMFTVLSDSMYSFHGIRWVIRDKGNRIPVADFQTALQVTGQDVDLDEAECLVANMIYRGYIRGYISHEKRMIVLANTNAFPRLTDRPSPYALY